MKITFALGGILASLVLLVGCDPNADQALENHTTTAKAADTKTVQSTPVATNGGYKEVIAFTKDGDHPEKLLSDLIRSSKSTLDISIYSITEKSILDAILYAQR